MFVNDLPEDVDSHRRLFADDAKQYKDLQNLEDFDTIQNDLNNLSADNKMAYLIKC